MRALPFILYVVITAYCVADAVQHPEPSPHGVPKWAWIVIILLFPYIGALVWIILKFTRGTGRSRPQPRPMAPDDDPQYLIWLNEQERRRKLGND
ncbi:PLD nuclease N-terminal domain-containing protein [Demequina sp. B12]|uniref:PLD nuclease N-terminal domain-containing protein n=1 Tax=Demequina sp. B12 TaxID=2992757 RepID=UPI00237C08BA|nr:PLD nuclease N-terminal domain-containing protein [Demequina sp. B12]MDE0572334.1 PLD nuclease N-terminal domain-containing protein [Demequina sp. B12]